MFCYQLAGKANLIEMLIKFALKYFNIVTGMSRAAYALPLDMLYSLKQIY